MIYYNKPFMLAPQDVGIVPISFLLAQTATDQIDALYSVADDPATPKDRATRLAQMAANMLRQISA